MQSQDSKGEPSADKVKELPITVLVSAKELLIHPASKELGKVYRARLEELRDALETTDDIQYVRGQIRELRETARLSQRLSRIITAREKTK